MKHRNSIMGAFILSLLLNGCTTTTTPSEHAVRDKESERVIYSEINAYRVKQHLPALQINSAVTEAALKHSFDMADRSIEFGHGGFHSRIHGLFDELKPVSGGAENVAFNSGTPTELVTMWIKSPLHRENIVGSYNLTGIGVYRDSHGREYATQIFLRKA